MRYTKSIFIVFGIESIKNNASLMISFGGMDVPDIRVLRKSKSKQNGPEDLFYFSEIVH